MSLTNATDSGTLFANRVARQKCVHWILLASILILGLFLRVYQIGKASIWLDEAFSIWISKFGLKASLGWIIGIDVHPPLYYLLLNAWMRAFGDSATAVRLLSALLGFCALPFFYGAVKRFTDSQTALIALFMLALSSFNIKYSQEAKMYSLLVLGTAASLYFLSRILTAEKTLWPVWVGYAFSQTAVMMTHNIGLIFYPVIVNAVVLTGWLFRKHISATENFPAMNRSAFLKKWLLVQAACLLLWSPWLIPFIHQTFRIKNDFWIPFPDLGSIYLAFQTFNFSCLPWKLPFGWLCNLLYCFLAVAGIISLRGKPVTLLLLLGLYTGPIVGELVLSFKRPIFLDRSLINVTLPYFILLAAGIKTLGAFSFREKKMESAGKPFLTPKKQTFVILLVLAFVSLLAGLALDAYYRYRQTENWVGATDFAAKQTQPGDLIVFNATWTQLPFDYYFKKYQRPNEMRGLPVDLFDRGQLEPKMTMADVPAMVRLFEGRKRICLVYSHSWFTDPEQLIKRAMDSLMIEKAHGDFSSIEIIVYELVPSRWNEANVLKELEKIR